MSANDSLFSLDDAAHSGCSAVTCSLPSSSGISSLRLATDRRKEKRLLPFGRLARSIKPRIGRLPWTSKGGNNLSGGKLGKRFSEGHGQILPLKKKSAMQKKDLAKCPQCRQPLRMSNTQYRVSFTVENVRHSTQWFNSEAEAMNSRWMNEDNAEIITRECPTFTRPW